MSVPAGVVQDYVRWQRRLRQAIEGRDERAESNAREMLGSIEEAARNRALPITAAGEGFAEGVAQGAGFDPGTLARVGRGYVDVREGIRQAFGAESPEQAARNVEDVEQYEAGVEEAYGPESIDVARIVGQAVPTSGAGAIIAAAAPVTAPGLAASTLTRAGIGAVTGGGSGGLIYGRTPEERQRNIVTGAVTGGVLGPALPAATRAAAAGGRALRRGARAGMNRLMAGLSRAADDRIAQAAQRAGVSLESVGRDVVEQMQDDVTRALQAGTDLDDAALQRRLRAAAFGFTDDAAPTTAQLRRDPGQWGDEVNAARAEGGEALQARFQAQRDRGGAFLDELAEEIGGPGARAVTPQAAGEGLEEAVGQAARTRQGAVSAAYDAAEAARPDVALPLDRMREGINSLRETWDLSTLPAGVRDRVQGMFRTGTATPRQLVNLREMLGNSRTADPGTNALIGRMQGLVDDTLDQAAEFSEDYARARGLARQRFEAIGPRGRAAGQIVDVTRETDPVRIADTLRTGSVRDIARLRDLAMEGNSDQWRRAQASVLNYIADRARVGDNFSEAQLRNTLRSIGPDRLRAVFGEETAQRLFDFRDAVGDLMRPPPGARIQTSNNYPAFLSLMRRALGFTGPMGEMVTGAAEGALQRGRTGAAVRQALSGTPAAAQAVQPNRLIPPYALGAGVPAGAVSSAAALNRLAEPDESRRQR